MFPIEEIEKDTIVDANFASLHNMYSSICQKRLVRCMSLWPILYVPIGIS